jgi:hypothetical protein
MDHRFAQVFGTSFAATVPHRNLVRRTVVLDHDRVIYGDVGGTLVEVADRVSTCTHHFIH